VAVEEQVLSIYAVTNGFMDGVEEDAISRFEKGLADFVRTRHARLLETIRTEGTLPDTEALDEAISAFAESFEG
jgi:F-type H+-transporting ATPase subunit alpha